MPSFTEEVDKIEKQVRRRGYDKKAEDEMKKRWEHLRNKKGLKP